MAREIALELRMSNLRLQFRAAAANFNRIRRLTHRIRNTFAMPIDNKTLKLTTHSLDTCSAAVKLLRDTIRAYRHRAIPNGEEVGVRFHR